MFFSGNNLEVDHTNFRELPGSDDGSTSEWDGPVELILHQSNQIAHFLQDNSLVKSTKIPPFPKVHRNKEYWIEVTPYVQKTTEAFKSIHLQNRGCRLQHEVYENSAFKSYTMENCKYECRVKKAAEICSCIPWDFIHNDRLIHECDIFGRTCFYNAIRNLTSSNDNLCKHCVKECDYATYDIVEIKKNNLDFTKKYFEYFDVDKNNGQCTGERAFCDYFTAPINGTIIDKGLENSFNAMAFYSLWGTIGDRPGLNNTGLKKSEDLIIVHLRILKPEIKVIDAKYSTMDKFANFGGNFGIFAEITGCSFLGMLNFLILLFKLIFSPRTNLMKLGTQKPETQGGITQTQKSKPDINPTRNLTFKTRNPRVFSGYLN